MILYRYEIEYRLFDGDTNVHLREYAVTEETDRSYCIRPFGAKKWIRKDAYNAFAHTTKKAAMEHFIRRTSTRISWFEFWMEECKKALELVKEIDTNAVSQ